LCYCLVQHRSLKILATFITADLYHLAKNPAAGFVWRLSFRRTYLTKMPLDGVSCHMMTYKQQNTMVPVNMIYQYVLISRDKVFNSITHFYQRFPN
jgi:hypothetical protein